MWTGANSIVKIYWLHRKTTRPSSDTKKKAINAYLAPRCPSDPLGLTFFCIFAEASLRACKAPRGVVDTPESKDSKDEFGRGRPPQQPLAAYRAND